MSRNLYAHLSDRLAIGHVCFRGAPYEDEDEEEEDKKDEGDGEEGIRMTTKMAATQCECVVIDRTGER